MTQPTRTSVGSARVLVVDDEVTTRAAITRGLSLMGYQADSAANGRQALAKLNEAPYDLLLLDLRMPEMDGEEVMVRVWEQQPDLPVVVLTAHGSVDSAILAVRGGAADYLLKPCSLREIEAVIARSIARQREIHRQDQVIRMITYAVGASQPEPEPQARAAHGAASASILRQGPITLDRDRRVAVVLSDVREVRANLTAHEASLLAVLMQYPDRVLSCRELALEALQTRLGERQARTLVRPHITRLRRKIEPDPGHPTLISTVRGKGYTLACGPGD